MKRREFIALLGGATASWPLAVCAQQASMPVIGLLSSATPEAYAPRIAVFQRGLAEAGFIEGKTVAFEFRHAGDQRDRLPAMAADLVRRRVAVIVAMGINAALAAKAATTTIPIVFSTGGDPVERGLVAKQTPPS